MNQNKKVVYFKKYKRRKEKIQDWFVLIPIYLTFGLAIYAYLFFADTPHDSLNVKTITETHAFLYK